MLESQYIRTWISSWSAREGLNKDLRSCASLRCNRSPEDCEMSGSTASDAKDLTAGLRLGMYAPLKTVVGADTDPTLLKKIAAGSASGAIATFITNPIELLKTRLQSNSTMGPLAVMQKIVRENGVTGLWKGTLPSAVSWHLFRP